MRLLAVTLLLVGALAAQVNIKQGIAPRNLKLLDPGEVMPAMRQFSAALGAKCGFCHAGEDYPSDANPKKNTARMMITMTSEINAKFPDGKIHVNCYTCHRGAAKPSLGPVLKGHPTGKE